MPDNGTTDIRVQLATLKQEVENVNSIHGRIDTAIDKTGRHTRVINTHEERRRERQNGRHKRRQRYDDNTDNRKTK